MKNIFKITFLVFTVFCLLYFISPVQAQMLGNEYLTNFGEAAGYGEAGLPEIIGNIVKIGLSLLGLIAIIIMIAGGFIWMTSGGIPEKVTKAKKIISSGLVGLLIIVFAYAIVSFIMSRLVGITEQGPGGPGGCTPSLCCGSGLRCNVDGDCNISDPNCSLPPDAFRIKKIETTHGGYIENYNQDVYLCSAIQPIFNHSVDGQTIEDLETAGELRIETGASPVSGNWQTRDGVIIFKHPDIFTENTSYEAFFPKAILDTQGKILQQCLAAGGCVDAGSYFIWNFMTGTTVDNIPPEITSTYPIFDLTDPNYPDQNISRKPSIEISFSEAIDMTTVSDENNYPIETNIWLSELDSQGGTVVEILVKDIFEIDAKSNGFRISLRDENLLEPFTWYRIHIEGVEDLCLNAMAMAIEWEFQTNDQAPGISSQYPNGNKVCPDTDITAVFNTQMYDNLVRFEITGGDSFTFDIRASELESPYEKIVTGGIFKVTDPGDPVNNHFRVFTFDPDNDLKSNKNYQVTVLTDLVIDQQGTLFSHTWDFKTATLENCLCSPWISRLDPEQGSKGECITLHGQCFQGTPAQPANPIKIEFILGETYTEAVVGGFGQNYITTAVPDVYSEEDRPEVQTSIEYGNGDQLTSNPVDFYVNSDDQANGPCLLSINPSKGYSSETKVDLLGIRFSLESATSSQVVFYNNKPAATYQSWSDQKVNDALVPLGVEDGLVYLVNNQGTSNGLPFEVLQHLAGSGEICQQLANCPNKLYSCSTPVYNCLYELTDTCRCCCNPGVNSCLAPLECMANQGSCTGITRGLCCGCESDEQCGAGLGCGFLDTNKCCHNRPTIISNSPVGEAVCFNTAIEANFSQVMDRNSLNKNNIKLEKLPPLIESKYGRNYTASQYSDCLDQSTIYTGRCDVNWWDYNFNILEDGAYQIYVETSNSLSDVKNFGEDGICSEPGVQHHVKVFVDGVEKGDFCADATLGHQISKVSLGNLIIGTYTIRLEWDNEWFDSPHDSSIRIYQVDLRQQAIEQDVDYKLIINGDNDQINLLPVGCILDIETSYKIELIGGTDGQGIRDSMGVSMNDYNWQFTTGDENNICEIYTVSVSPDSATVESFEDRVVYMAQGYDINNNQVCVAEFLWESDISIAMVNPNQGLETTVSPVGGEGTQTTDISATIDSYSGSGEFTSVLSPPVITGINPNQGTNNPVIPTYVTITGTGFGDKQNDSYIQFDNFEAEIGCQNWSNLEIVAIVPPDLELTLEEDDPYSVTVTSDQGQSNLMPFEVTGEFYPAICQLLPNQGQTGTQIGIQGLNFGDQQGDAYVVFGEGGSNPQTIDEIEEDDWFNTQIVITAPEVPEEVANLVVYVPSPIETGNPFKPSNAVSFYKSPRITSISPEKGPKRTWITIKGENFGLAKGNTYFKYNDTNYLAGELPSHCLNYWTTKEIIIAVPETLPDLAVEDNSYQMEVYVETANGTLSNLVKWEVNKEAIAPALCEITPNDNLQVNDSVIVLGDRFNLYSGELDRRLVFPQNKIVTPMVWNFSTSTEAVIPLGVISGDVFIEKDVEVNCHLECDGLSFAGQCFGGAMIPVCSNAKIRSNPLSITLLAPEDPETFALPKVFENSTCLNNTRSPSPSHKSSQACSNALISARFNMKVDNLSDIDNNIIVEKCNPGNEEFDSGLCIPGDIGGTIEETDKTFDNPQRDAIYLYPDITTANRFCFEIGEGYTGFKATYSTTTTGSVDDYMRYVDGQWVEENSVERIDTILCSKGFIYTPDASLTQNYWYQVTLKSGDTGIISSVDNYQLDGNKDGIEDDSPNDDYIWYFKTKAEAEACSAQAIKISEQNPVGIIIDSGDKDYSALPIGPDCQILRPDTFTWGWESTDIEVATVGGSANNSETATAVDLGETEIKVTATIDTESAINSIDLIVATYPDVEIFKPSGDSICRNSAIKTTFNQLMDKRSISSETVSIYGKYLIDQTSLDCTFVPQGQAYNNLNKSFFAQVFSKFKNLFIKKIFAASATNDYYLCEILINISVFNNAEDKTEVNINAGLLDVNQEYKVTILGGTNGVKSIYGVDMENDYEAIFTTSDEICTLSRVDIEPNIVNFTATSESENLIAYTYDNNSNPILGISGVYDWTWLWESSDDLVVSVAGSILDSETITALNRNGKVQITATATPTYGDSVSGHSKIDVFLCENPWLVDENPYQDLETNFELRYCRDKTPELLPELSVAEIGGSEDLIKEFLFTVGETGDVIGLKVFNNLERLSVLDWYNQNAPNPGNPRSFVIDNYFALQEGRTTYVAATNIAESTFNNPQHNGYYLYNDDATADQFCIEKGFSGADNFSYIYCEEEDVKQYTGEWSVLLDFYQRISSIICNSSLENGIYNHIYLISYNDNAGPETIEIFSQILNNWEFNINLDNPIDDKPKLQNDLSRLYNLEEIKDKLKEYHKANKKYPTLGAGTFVSGKTNSKWSSWQNTLSQILKSSLPVDPINEFNGSCAGCPNDPSQSDYQCQGTCYNLNDQFFYIPDGSHVYQYYVPEQEECLGVFYSLAVNLEYWDGNITWKGETPEKDIVIIQADTSGYYNYRYYSDERPICGNGIFECGEECECDGGSSPCCSPKQPSGSGIYCSGSPSFTPVVTCGDLGQPSHPSGFLTCHNCEWNFSSCNKKLLGESCSNVNDCHSGNCVDDVCCDTSCDGGCEYCGEGLGGSAGTCHYISAGNEEDGNDECTNTTGCLTGNCNGDGTCDHSYKDNEKHDCNDCEVCDDITGDCTGITDSGPIPLDTACTNCKKCSSGICVDQTTTEDLFGHCSTSWSSCDSNKCVRRGNNGLCDNSGSCDTNSQTENISSGNVCTGAGNVVNVVSAAGDAYCGSPENICLDNKCSGIRWYRSCNGSGVCREVGDHTGAFSESITADANYLLKSDCSQVSRSTSNYCGSIINSCTDGACIGYKYYRGCDDSGACKTGVTGAYSENIYASESYTLTSNCEDGTVTPKVPCGYSDWLTCTSDCGKRKDKFRCTDAGVCAYKVGGQLGNVAENTVCVNPSPPATSVYFCPNKYDCETYALDTPVSSTDYCGIGNSCSAGTCSGKIYYRGCDGSGDCKTDNTGAAPVTVNATLGKVLDMSCSQYTAQCATCHQCDAGGGNCDPITGTGMVPYLGCGTGTCCTGVCCNYACCGSECCSVGVVCCNGNCCDVGETCKGGVCCTANQCEYDGVCYNSGDCRDTYICSNSGWISHCGDGITNCSEVCDSTQTQSCGNCDIGTQSCLSDCGAWGICTGDGVCSLGESQYIPNDKCTDCSASCFWGSAYTVYCITGYSFDPSCLKCGNTCDADEYCCSKYNKTTGDYSTTICQCSSGCK